MRVAYPKKKQITNKIIFMIYHQQITTLSTFFFKPHSSEMNKMDDDSWEHVGQVDHHP